MATSSRRARLGQQVAALPPTSFFLVSAVFHYQGGPR